MNKDDEYDVEHATDRATRDAKGKADQAGGWFSRKGHQARDASSDAGHSAHHGLHKAAVRSRRRRPAAYRPWLPCNRRAVPTAASGQGRLLCEGMQAQSVASPPLGRRSGC